jgi:hypothetical protein
MSQATFRAVRCFNLAKMETVLFAVTPETSVNWLAQIETLNCPERPCSCAFVFQRMNAETEGGTLMKTLVTDTL